MIKIASLLSVLILLNACSDNGQSGILQFGKTGPIIVDIQPFDGIPLEHVRFVNSELQKVYPHIQVKPSIRLPELAFYKKRARYRADSLIRYMHRITPKGHITLGLTNKDISHTKGKIKDFGIMGLAYQPGNSCVVSTFRLSKTEVLNQLFKTAIHELGHTQGLPHCPVKTCFMRDAEGKNRTNEETSFCPDCSDYLASKGWENIK